MGNFSSNSYLSNISSYSALKSKEIIKMIVGSIKEDLALEKRISLHLKVRKI